MPLEFFHFQRILWGTLDPAGVLDFQLFNDDCGEPQIPPGFLHFVKCFREPQIPPGVLYPTGVLASWRLFRGTPDPAGVLAFRRML